MGSPISTSNKSRNKKIEIIMFFIVLITFIGGLMLNSVAISAYPTSTETSKFRCVTYGYSIPVHLQCDGINNCGDNSDEENCVSAISTTPKHETNIEITLPAQSKSASINLNQI